MTKAEMIEKHGIEWYRQFVERVKQQNHKRYHADIEKAHAKRHEYYLQHKERHNRYHNEHREIYRINCRDNRRLFKMGLLKEGHDVHHLKYHSDNNDKSWINDVIIMPSDEHAQWHRDHPDFKAVENVV